jgi:hypothetical protein
MESVFPAGWPARFLWPRPCVWAKGQEVAPLRKQPQESASPKRSVWHSRQTSRAFTITASAWDLPHSHLPQTSQCRLMESLSMASPQQGHFTKSSRKVAPQTPQGRRRIGVRAPLHNHHHLGVPYSSFIPFKPSSAGSARHSERMLHGRVGMAPSHCHHASPFSGSRGSLSPQLTQRRTGASPPAKWGFTVAVAFLKVFSSGMGCRLEGEVTLGRVGQRCQRRPYSIPHVCASLKPGHPCPMVWVRKKRG